MYLFSSSTPFRFSFTPCSQAFGYGAQLPPQWVVSHAFALNGNNASPKVVGVAGLLAAYAQAIQTVRLHGPTNFAPIINAVASQCHANTGVNPFLYTVLLIVTDGEALRAQLLQHARTCDTLVTRTRVQIVRLQLRARACD